MSSLPPPTKGEKYSVLDYGHVMYLDHMGSDQDIVDAARLSYESEGDPVKDMCLIRYLLRHRHTSPFEMCELKIEVKMPIFVARQWHRHRTASINEVSARYTRLPDEVFFPENFPRQSSTNNQGRADEEASNTVALDLSYRRSRDQALMTYDEMLKNGVAREIARCVLPVATYTKFVWKIDLHNLMHFLKLRLDKHAQKEIRVYAEAINELVWRLWPVTAQAFHDYIVSSYTLSRIELAAIKMLLVGHPMAFVKDACLNSNPGMTEREWSEFEAALST